MSPVTARGVGREEKDEAEMTGTQRHEPMIPPGRVTVKYTFTAGVGTRCLAAGLLVQADDVSSGIPESRSHLGCVRADRLDERASLGGDGIDRGGHAVDHDINEQARL